MKAVFEFLKLLFRHIRDYIIFGTGSRFNFNESITLIYVLKLSVYSCFIYETVLKFQFLLKWVASPFDLTQFLKKNC